jgi:hypothetical protein
VRRVVLRANTHAHAGIARFFYSSGSPVQPKAQGALSGVIRGPGAQSTRRAPAPGSGNTRSAFPSLSLSRSAHSGGDVSSGGHAPGAAHEECRPAAGSCPQPGSCNKNRQNKPPCFRGRRGDCGPRIKAAGSRRWRLNGESVTSGWVCKRSNGDLCRWRKNGGAFVIRLCCPGCHYWKEGAGRETCMRSIAGLVAPLSTPVA